MLHRCGRWYLRRSPQCRPSRSCRRLTPEPMPSGGLAGLWSSARPRSRAKRIDAGTSTSGILIFPVFLAGRPAEDVITPSVVVEEDFVAAALDVAERPVRVEPRKQESPTWLSARTERRCLPVDERRSRGLRMVRARCRNFQPCRSFGSLRSRGREPRRRRHVRGASRLRRHRLLARRQSSLPSTRLCARTGRRPRRTPRSPGRCEGDDTPD